MNKITVVIPCYNAEQYIDKCVTSLLKQTNQNFDVIFIDDSSKDKTVEKLENIALNCNLNIRILKNEKNSGPAYSRNRGILSTSTEYITFCDADDSYEPDFLSKLFNQLEKNKADLVVCGYSIVDENGNKEQRPLNFNGILRSKTDILKLDVDSLCMLMVKTKIMKETLLPNIRNGEDMAVVPLLMIKSNYCVVIDECLYNYFRRSNSASEKPTMKVVDSFIASFDYLRKNFPKEYIEVEEFIGIRNLLYAGLITLFSFSFDIKKANQIIHDFEKYYPNWTQNQYLNELPNYKKFLLKLANKHAYWGIWILARVRNILTGKH